MSSSCDFNRLKNDPARVANMALDLITFWANVTHTFFITDVDGPITVDDVKAAEKQLVAFADAFETFRFATT